MPFVLENILNLMQIFKKRANVFLIFLQDYLFKEI
jgi:hypothetical protein